MSRQGKSGQPVSAFPLLHKPHEARLPPTDPGRTRKWVHRPVPDQHTLETTRQSMGNHTELPSDDSAVPLPSSVSEGTLTPSGLE